jgi:hypothetical protein
VIEDQPFAIPFGKQVYDPVELGAIRGALLDRQLAVDARVALFRQPVAQRLGVLLQRSQHALAQPRGVLRIG